MKLLDNRSGKGLYACDKNSTKDIGLKFCNGLFFSRFFFKIKCCGNNKYFNKFGKVGLKTINN